MEKSMKGKCKMDKEETQRAPARAPRNDEGVLLS
jgi:hypothetical protein